jgi:hypothetical protein
VAPGETVVCRFRIRGQQGTIIIEKQTVNGNGTTTFSFHEDRNRPAPPLTPASDAAVASQSFVVPTDSGAFDITEQV